jgi:hypothetical protein
MRFGLRCAETSVLDSRCNCAVVTRCSACAPADASSIAIRAVPTKAIVFNLAVFNIAPTQSPEITLPTVPVFANRVNHHQSGDALS